jgi:hypothetical protein
MNVSSTAALTKMYPWHILNVPQHHKIMITCQDLPTGFPICFADLYYQHMDVSFCIANSNWPICRQIELGVIDLSFCSGDCLSW